MSFALTTKQNHLRVADPSVRYSVTTHINLNGGEAENTYSVRKHGSGEQFILSQKELYSKLLKEVGFDEVTHDYYLHSRDTQLTAQVAEGDLYVCYGELTTRVGFCSTRGTAQSINAILITLRALFEPIPLVHIPVVETPAPDTSKLLLVGTTPITAELYEKHMSVKYSSEFVRGVSYERAEAFVKTYSVAMGAEYQLLGNNEWEAMFNYLGLEEVIRKQCPLESYAGFKFMYSPYQAWEWGRAGSAYFLHGIPYYPNGAPETPLLPTSIHSTFREAGDPLVGLRVCRYADLG